MGSEVGPENRSDESSTYLFYRYMHAVSAYRIGRLYFHANLLKTKQIFIIKKVNFCQMMEI